MPTSIKSYKTLAYEGTQARVSQNLNDNNYHNLSSINGWYCESITTDLDEGNVKEFINKENKWFNYIKGNQSNTNTSNFNFQGLGVPFAGNTPPQSQPLVIQNTNVTP